MSCWIVGTLCAIRGKKPTRKWTPKAIHQKRTFLVLTPPPWPKTTSMLYACTTNVLSCAVLYTSSKKITIYIFFFLSCFTTNKIYSDTHTLQDILCQSDNNAKIGRGVIRTHNNKIFLYCLSLNLFAPFLEHIYLSPLSSPYLYHEFNYITI